MGMFGRARHLHRLELIGLRSAGKTSIMYRLARQPVPDNMLPTGVPVLEKQVNSEDGHKFLFSEQKQETEGASAVIYVLDATDCDRGASDLKEHLLQSANPQAPLLVLVNKTDLVDVEASLDKVTHELGPAVGTGRSWAVLGCSATENTGIVEAEQWLQTKLKI